jgi:hypothetical protein
MGRITRCDWPKSSVEEEAVDRFPGRAQDTQLREFTILVLAETGLQVTGSAREIVADSQPSSSKTG